MLRYWVSLARKSCNGGVSRFSSWTMVIEVLGEILDFLFLIVLITRHFYETEISSFVAGTGHEYEKKKFIREQEKRENKVS